jgi:hypothetical protein
MSCAKAHIMPVCRDAGLPGFHETQNGDPKVAVAPTTDDYANRPSISLASPRWDSSPSVNTSDKMIVLDIRAGAFLHHMVRNIAGVLMTIGTGERPVEWAKEVLESRIRRTGGVTAHPFGLYLVDVEYRDEFELPERFIGPHFLTGFSELGG